MFERARAQEYSRQAVTAPLTSDHGVACGPPVGTRRVARRLLGELDLTLREPVGYGSEPMQTALARVRSRATVDANRFFRS
jgi:hypothetical protein